ncbi:MAG: hypothetical protein QOI82_3118 [Actinomycetota bacterium]|jgi:hypothetical protein|nr:hypothetical protein [Actinomycetota bacterium]
MRKQYSFRPGADGLDAWDVDRLIELSAGLEVEELPLEDIAQLDENYWYDHGYSPTVRSIADRVRLVQAADPSYPIIVSPEGRVMDGMHRVVRALVEGRTTIPAVRLRELPPPDYTNCHPDDLPYERSTADG